MAVYFIYFLRRPLDVLLLLLCILTVLFSVEGMIPPFKVKRKGEILATFIFVNERRTKKVFEKC